MRSDKGFDQIAYQNAYIKEKYDRISLTVPKGRKAEIKKKAAAMGKSVNEYINSLVDRDLCQKEQASGAADVFVSRPFNNCQLIISVVFEKIFVVTNNYDKYKKFVLRRQKKRSMV